jgi:hypothetical protein
MYIPQHYSGHVKHCFSQLIHALPNLMCISAVDIKRVYSKNQKKTNKQDKHQTKNKQNKQQCHSQLDRTSKTEINLHHTQAW